MARVKITQGWGGGGNYLSPEGAWTPDRFYAALSQVTHNNDLWRSLQGHISTPDTEPGVGANWTAFWAREVNNITVAQQAALDANTSLNAEHPVADQTDARFPTIDFRLAMVGSYGDPDADNPYVTNSDPRMTNSRFPTAHAASHVFGMADAITGIENLPIAGEKAALPGSYGFPGADNKYVTSTDPRMSDARTPLSHGHPESEIVFAATGGHAHTGTDATQVDYDDLDNIPSAFTPSAHDLVSAYHSVAGLTPGHVLRASAADAYGFAALQSGDIPDLSGAYVAVSAHDKTLHDGLGIDADTLDGSHASAFAVSGHNHDLTYAPLAHNQNASTIQAGTFGDGDFYFQDNLQIGLLDSSAVKGNLHIAAPYGGTDATAPFRIYGYPTEEGALEKLLQLYTDGTLLCRTYMNALIGFQVNSAAANGQFLVGDGTKFAGRALASTDLPDLSGTYQVVSAKGQASGYASLDASTKVVQDPANAQSSAAENKIPIAGTGGKIASGWIPDLSGTYSVTGHSHSHTALTDIGTNAHSTIDTFISSKASASGLASLDGSSKVVQDPANATATPTQNKIPIASGVGGALASGWIPDLSATYAVAAKGVTNGDSHDHDGGDGAQVNHTKLSNIGTNAHSVIDTFIASKAAASGLASLDSSSLVVQNPANATATPTASKIPIADGSAKLDGWITAGSTGAAGLVKLANHLGGTSLLPTVIGLQETGGPTSLLYGAIADGQYLKRSGATVIGDTLTAADVGAGTFPNGYYTIGTGGALILGIQNDGFGEGGELILKGATGYADWHFDCQAANPRLFSTYDADGVFSLLCDAAGRTLAISADGYINSGVGFRVAGAATDGHVLIGDGTNFAGRALTAADVGAGTFPSGNFAFQGNIGIGIAVPEYRIDLRRTDDVATYVSLHNTSVGSSAIVGHRWSQGDVQWYMWAKRWDGYAYSYPLWGGIWLGRGATASEYWLGMGDRADGKKYAIFNIDYMGIGITPPAAQKVHIYDNTTGATNPVLLVHQDHASNTGALIKGVHDGTGNLLHLYNGATERIKIEDTGKMTLAGDFAHQGTNLGFYSTTPAARSTGWTTFTNLSTDKTCDANSTTVEELADILGTLIVDLKAVGLLAA